MSLPSRPRSDDPRAQQAKKEAEDEARRRAQDPAYRKAHQRAERWEDATAWPLFVLSLVFFAANIVFFDTQRTSGDQVVYLASSITIVVLWLVFIADYVVRLSIAPHKLEFVKRRWFELLAIVIPWLRPFVLVSFLWRLPLFKKSETAVRARFIVAVVAFALVFVYTGSATVYVVEVGDPRANIRNLGDAIWWGFSTITTVGYGDYAPVTFLGRTVAVLMMVGGVFVVGVVSAVVISLLLDQMERFGYRVTAQIVADRDGTETVQVGGDDADSADGGSTASADGTSSR